MDEEEEAIPASLLLMAPLSPPGTSPGDEGDADTERDVEGSLTTPPRERPKSRRWRRSPSDWAPDTEQHQTPPSQLSDPPPPA